MDAPSVESMRQRGRAAILARAQAGPSSATPPATAQTYPWHLPAGGVLLVATLVTATVVTVVMVAALLTIGAGPGRVALGAELSAAAIGAVALAAVVWLRRFADVPVLARGALVLALVQLAIAAAALVLWTINKDLDPEIREMWPLVDALPAPAVAFGLGALVVLAALRIRGRQVGAPRWLYAVVVIALGYLLALALWLPIWARFGVSEHQAWYADDGMQAQVPFVLAPAAVMALLATLGLLVAQRRPRLAAHARLPVAMLLGFVLVTAVTARLDGGEGARRVYGNFAHVLFSAASFALATLVALAWAHGRALRAERRDRARPAPWNQVGTVVIEPPSSTTVGALVHTGWLSGVRPTVRGFTLRTATAELPIPAGTALVAPVPPWTAQAPVGTAVPILSEGDQVTVSGFVAAAGGDAIYRSGGVPIAGTEGLVVTLPRRADEPAARDLVLWLWRPCAIFLAVVSIAAVPGLLGLLPR